MLLALSCAGENTSEVVFALQDEHRNLWVRENALLQCGLPKEKLTESWHYHDHPYYALKQFDDLTYQYDEKEMTLEINVALKALHSHHVFQPKRELFYLRPEKAGAYLNYDIHLQWIKSFEEGTLSGLGEAIYFNRYGVGSWRFLGQSFPHTKKWVRLDTTWTLDKPEEIASWRLGDSVTRSTIWSGAVQFGGIQYATNFATQPGLITFPLPAFHGEAVVPTTMQFYLQQQLQATHSVGRGVFDIENIPVVTGAGEIIVQSKDILGRENLVTLPYYASQRLLKPGLADFSYELGWIRENLGIKSNDYGRWVGVGTYQKGLTPTWTAGWHGELLENQQTIGIQSQQLLRNWVEFNWASAVSWKKAKMGQLFLLGLSHNSEKYNVGFQLTGRTPQFQFIGLLPDALAPRFLFQGTAGLNGNKLGSLSVSYTQRSARREDTVGVATVTYTRMLWKQFFSIWTLLYQTHPFSRKSGLFYLVWSPKKDHTATVGFTYDATMQETAVITSWDKQLPTDSGIGYQLVGGIGRNAPLQAQLGWQTKRGLYSAQVLRQAEQTGFMLDGRGSWLYFGKRREWGRYIDNSFALVEIPGLSNIEIYRSNQPVGKTDKEGYLLIPQLLPYEENILSVHAEDLPLTAQIDSDQQKVFPYSRSGAYVKFPIITVVHVVAKLVNKEGMAIPAGAILQLPSGKSYPVGYEGTIFFSQAISEKKIKGTVKWQQKHCQFSANLPAVNAPINDLGVLQCM